MDDNVMIDQIVDDIEEIAPHERLAAREVHAQNARIDDLARDIHDRIVIELAQQRVRCIHVAMLAAVVAPARNGPMRRADTAVGMTYVALIVC